MKTKKEKLLGIAFSSFGLIFLFTQLCMYFIKNFPTQLNHIKVAP